MIELNDRRTECKDKSMEPKIRILEHKYGITPQKDKRRQVSSIHCNSSLFESLKDLFYLL